MCVRASVHMPACVSDCRGTVITLKCQTSVERATRPPNNNSARFSAGRARQRASDCGLTRGSNDHLRAVAEARRSRQDARDPSSHVYKRAIWTGPLKSHVVTHVSPTPHQHYPVREEAPIFALMGYPWSCSRQMTRNGRLGEIVFTSAKSAALYS